VLIEGIRNPLLGVPEKKVNESEISKIYTFCLAWSIGSFLEIEDRIKFDTFLHESCKDLNLSLPNKAEDKTIFDYVMDKDKWSTWDSRLGECTLPENFTNEFSSVMVPNVDSVRTNFLIDTVAKQVKSVSYINNSSKFE
jgi:dynein heavy chain